MSRPAMKDCNLFFCDFETGGLDATTSDIVEMACIVTDPTGQTVISEYSQKVLPLLPVDPGAARVNGYTREKWATEAINCDTAMVKFLGLARDTVFVSHNTPFDWSFLQAAMAKRGQRWIGDYHKIDTVALAMPLLKAGLVANVKLVTLSEHFGIEHAAHTALGDARACRGVYLKMMALFARGLAAA